MKVANVADVQDVEAAVGQCDAIAGAAPCGDAPLEFEARDDLRVEWWSSMNLDCRTRTPTAAKAGFERQLSQR